jgi:hypothetical protein
MTTVDLGRYQDARNIDETKRIAERILGVVDSRDFLSCHAAFSVAAHLLMQDAYGDREQALSELEGMIDALRTIVTRGTFNTQDPKKKEETGEAYIARITREGLVTTTQIYADDKKREAVR